MSTDVYVFATTYFCFYYFSSPTLLRFGSFISHVLDLYSAKLAISTLAQDKMGGLWID